MKTSTDRILTTHVGSLPRPDKLIDMLFARYQHQDCDEAEFAATVTKAVTDVVHKQVEAGIDIVSDGEMGKISYSQYVKHRLSGITDSAASGIEKDSAADFGQPPPEFVEHPDWAAASHNQGPSWIAAPFCTADVSYGDTGPLETDLANFKAATDAAGPTDAILNAASPGVISSFCTNQHYASTDAFVEALADAMQPEYEAIVEAGFNLQLDCPDIAAGRSMGFVHLTDDDFLNMVDHRIEALNHATRNIPPEKMRMHVCWGNYNGPHTHDLPVTDLFKYLAKARPAAILFEGANPAHEHEWEDWQRADIPDDKILVPGVVDSTSNFVEHPRLVAQRIRRYADIVGRERVIAGTDCGFNTFASKPTVFPTVVWAKFRALAEGAKLASDALWGAQKSAGSFFQD